MKRTRFAGIAFTALLIATMAITVTACGSDDVTDVKEAIDEARQQVEGDGGKIEACDIVTQQMATELFGKPAAQDEGTPFIDPNILGECIWSWDTDLSNQLLQFRVWNGEQYYLAPDDSEPLDLGDKGFIRVHEMGGVDIMWLQDGNAIELSYFNIGSDVPEIQTMVQPMKDLAEQVSGEL